MAKKKAQLLKEIAGLGVDFNTTPVVREKATNAISSVGLDGLLYLIGIHDQI